MKESEMRANTEAIFTEIFRTNSWKGKVPSGPGSSPKATGLIRPQLATLFTQLGIRSLCDAPCGDGSWIFDITGELDLYLGVDVVRELVQANLKPGLPPNHFFACGDITRDVLPRADAILCRDCLVHFPLQTAQETLELLKHSGSTYLITTTFPQWPANKDARLGTWRPLNLQAAPFNLPPPAVLMRERAPNPDDAYNDKSLGVWALADI
jgi:hypothetical protein